MGFRDLIFGHGWKIRKLRKNWDRLREKALKTENPIRQISLEKLDRIEDHLRILEEQPISKKDRARLTKEVEIDLEEVKAILESKPEEIQPGYTSRTNI